VATNAPLPKIDITADQESFSPTAGYAFTGDVDVLGGSEFALRADNLTANDRMSIMSASGGISMRELDTTVTAQKLLYSEPGGFGVFDNATLNLPPYTLMAGQLALLAGQLDAVDANFSTCPPGKPQEFHFGAQYIQVNLVSHRIVARNAALYLGRNRIVEVKRLTFNPHPSGPSRKVLEGLQQTVGYDRYRGAYILGSANVSSGRFPINLSALIPTRSKLSVAATASTTFSLSHHASSKQADDGSAAKSSLIGLVRTLATSTGRPLPPGDPLLYHDFLGNDPLQSVFNSPVVAQLTPSATVSYRQSIYGRLIGNLSYSELPQTAAQLVIPIAGSGNLPTDRDPLAVRQALRRIYLFTIVTAQNGFYEEQPTDAQSSRSATLLTLDSRPILIADNTLFRPRLSYYTADYVTAHDRYGYEQADLSIQRSFSEETSIGAEYIGTFQGGKDPFVFDSVDAAQEFDIRGQIGGAHNIFGARLKTDLIHRSAIDWQLVYGRPLNCFTPTITYDHTSDSIGVGFSIEGITY
jgi:hypothetical protein